MKKYLLFILLLSFVFLLCGAVLPNRITQTGITLIKHYESFRSESYKCPAGVWTVGWGSTEGVKANMFITPMEAEILLMKDISKFEDHLRKNLTRIIRWNEWDALTSFCFNVGYRLKGDLRNAVNCGNKDLVVYHLSKYNKARVKGVLKVLPGLVKRRATEGILYKDAVLKFL